MKKTILTCILFVLFIILIIVILKFNGKIFDSKDINSSSNIVNENNDETIIKNQYVSYNGWLHTDGSNLKNEKNEIVQLRRN